MVRQSMNPCKFESQADLGKNFYLACGRVEIVTHLLKARFGSLSNEAQAQLAWSCHEQLYAIVDRALTATTLEEALAPKS